jgi:hypothetical protein
MSDAVRQISVLVAAIAMIAVNWLANALPLNGKTTGSISDSFPVYFVPAGYVFSIWGLIYVGVIAYVVYQALPSQRSNPLHRRIGYLFVAGSVANVAWIFLWHYEQFVLTLVAMAVLLVSLVAVYRQLHASPPSGGIAERLAVRVPFSIYLGWITVATIANVTVVLYDLRWDGWGIAPQAWAAIMLVVGGAIASAASLPRGDVAYMMVIVWAFAGIAVKQSATPLVAWTALGAAVILAGLIAVRLAFFRGAGRLPTAGA